MKKIIIDTNALISFVTDRNLKQQKKIAQLLQDTSKLRLTIQCHHHVISEFVYVLSSIYNCSNEAINQMISDFIAMPGIEIITDVNLTTLLDYWPDRITDYGDAVIAAQCKNSKGSAIATFDKKFKKSIKDIGLPLYKL
jgi:predicted nucleic acid-binding protein